MIVVPGPWTKADIRYQAEHIVSMKMHNSGFNCVAAQVLVLPDGWEHEQALLDGIRAVMAELDDRPPYYPGALERAEALADTGTSVDAFGSAHPRYLVDGIDRDADDAYAFTKEVFGPVLAIVRLPAPDVPSYLIKAVRFANDRLEGTLGAVVLIDPKTQRTHRGALRTGPRRPRVRDGCRQRVDRCRLLPVRSSVGRLPRPHTGRHR